MAWPTYIDDDGTGTTGTILDKAFFDQMKSYVDTGVVSIVNGGGNVFDVVLPTPLPLYYVRVAPTSADITLQAMTPGRNGDLLLISHVGSGGTVVWMHPNSGSLGWHQNRVSSGKTPIAPGGSALYVYDQPTLYWTLVQHDQGRAIRLPYSATNYAVNAGAWTVPSGSVKAHDYLLRGNVLHVLVCLESTTITGSPAYFYLRGWPVTFATNVSPPALLYSGSGFVAARVQATLGAAELVTVRLEGTSMTDTTNLQVHVSTAWTVT